MKIGYLMQAGVPDMRQRPLSGPANHVKHVFEELHKLGHHVRLLAFLDGQIWQSDDLEDYQPVPLFWLDKGPLHLFERGVRRIQSEFHLPYAALFESTRFALACRQALPDYDLFYERMGWMGYGGPLAAGWLKIPLVVEVNGDHMSEMEMLGVAPQGWQRKLSVALMSQAMRRVSHVVATGEGWRQRFIERWQIALDKVSVIENGSEIVNLLTRDQLRAFSSDENLAKTTTVIYIGAFEPWHGITVLISAVAKAIAEGALLRLVLVGSGTQHDTIEQLVHNLGLEKHVIFTGHLPAQQLAVHLANADIGVSPYCGRVEYSGLKLLDYKAAGLVTVASGEDGQPAVIEHGRTGWIVPACDEEALYQAIVQLAGNINLRQKMGRQARIEAESCHSWQHTAKQLEQLFTKVVAASASLNRPGTV